MRKIKNTSEGTLWLGTSGIVLPGNKNTFPPVFRDKSRLTYYSSIFNSLEVNSSFYKIPQSRTMLRWASEVITGFRFTIKLWKEITHVKDLKFKAKDIDLFLNTVILPASNRGCLLIQFPSKISFGYIKQVTRLLQQISKINDATGWQICIEFRHTSWYNPSTYALLNTLRVGMVLHDKSAGYDIPDMHAAEFVYFRFHGPAGNYRGSYSEEYLRKIAKLAEQWLLAGKDVYMYFNNTLGSAFQNARFVQSAILH